MRSITWAVSPASACTTTSRRWCSGMTPTARSYNPKFLAFATHYGFKPQACRVRRPQTKGKVERQFLYVETQPAQRPHLRHAGASQRGDGLVAGERRRCPRPTRLQGIAARAACRASNRELLPLPACDFDTAPMVYRHVNVEGFVTYRLELLLGAVVAHRPGAAGAHHRGRGHRLLDRPGRNCPASAGAQHAERRAADDQEPSSQRRSRPADVAAPAALRRTGPGRRAVPRRPAGQAGPGQAASPAVLALVAHYRRDDVLRGPGACRSLRRLLPGGDTPHSRGPRPSPSRRWRNSPSCTRTPSIHVCVSDPKIDRSLFILTIPRRSEAEPRLVFVGLVISFS